MNPSVRLPSEGSAEEWMPPSSWQAEVQTAFLLLPQHLHQEPEPDAEPVGEEAWESGGSACHLGDGEG